jgi:ribonuclease HI
MWRSTSGFDQIVTMKPSQDRQRPARHVNEVIDRALQQPTGAHFREALRLRATVPTQNLAERARRRATLLARRDRRHSAQILRSRDRLILAIYADATPAGWHTAWCDGSITVGKREAGIGGLLMDAAGQIVAELTRRVPGLTPFEAEIAALVAILQVARAQGVQRLRVYSDCSAVVQLRQQCRDDTRLAAVAALAREFRRLQVCALPRLHNQPAHRLAKTGAGHSGV